MKIHSWKTRASCGQSTSRLHFQFEFHITVLRYMGRVSVKQFLTNCNIKNMRFFLCTVYKATVPAMPESEGMNRKTLRQSEGTWQGKDAENDGILAPKGENQQ